MVASPMKIHSDGTAASPSAAGLWRVLELALAGECHDAAVLLCQAGGLKSWRGRWLASWLARRLLRSAGSLCSRQEFAAALDAVDDAARLTDQSWQSLLQRKRARICQSLRTSSGRCLGDGNWPAALGLLRELERRNLLDETGRELHNRALVAERVEWLASHGQLSGAIGLLRQLELRAPELRWIGPWVRNLSSRHGTSTGDDTLGRIGMEETARDILGSGGAKRPSVPSPPVTRLIGWSQVVPAVSSGEQGCHGIPRRMLMWVDGVGHYLLCLDPQLWIGRYVPLSGIGIPVLGDLHRRHLRLLRDCESGHAIQAFAPCEVVVSAPDPAVPGLWIPEPARKLKKGERWSIPDGTVVRLGLGSGTGNPVEFDLRRPRPESGTVVMMPVSRHRTVPAATSVIWCGRSLTIGAEATAEIRTGRSKCSLMLEFSEDGIRVSGSQSPEFREPGVWEQGHARSGLQLVWGDQSLVLEALETMQEQPCQ